MEAHLGLSACVTGSGHWIRVLTVLLFVVPVACGCLLEIAAAVAAACTLSAPAAKKPLCSSCSPVLVFFLFF